MSRLWRQADLVYYTDKAGWSIPDPLQFKTVVAVAELEAFYGEPAAEAFDRVTKEKPWRWQCIGGEPTGRKVLLL